MASIPSPIPASNEGDEVIPGPGGGLSPQILGEAVGVVLGLFLVLVYSKTKGGELMIAIGWAATVISGIALLYGIWGRESRKSGLVIGKDRIQFLKGPTTVVREITYDNIADLQLAVKPDRLAGKLPFEFIGIRCVDPGRVKARGEAEGIKVRSQWLGFDFIILGTYSQPLKVIFEKIQQRYQAFQAGR